MPQKTPENPKLTSGQRRFVKRWASLPFLTIADTAQIIGLSSETVYTWRKREPAFVRACDDARDAKQCELGAEAEAVLDEEILEIMRAKIELARYGHDERARDSAQTWALEHMLGKRNAVNKQEISGPNGGPIAVDVMLAELDRIWDRPLPGRESANGDLPNQS